MASSGSIASARGTTSTPLKPGHAHVAEHEDVLAALQQLERGRPDSAVCDVVAARAQELREREPDGLFVIDDEHAPRAAVSDDAIRQAATVGVDLRHADRSRDVSDWVSRHREHDAEASCRGPACSRR